LTRRHYQYKGNSSIETETDDFHESDQGLLTRQAARRLYCLFQLIACAFAGQSAQWTTDFS
jgi:hypothetical protein